MNKSNSQPVKLIRCAIYTRKSTEEGLDQEFNSLDSQREAAEAFIASQVHEGWKALSERYDDGGFSGGSMERPGLARLLEDIERGKIDCVVVYKVDRLSRSLLDFTKIIETFERHGVSFVSVTQQFNTTSSMGRLTLNILLSFAQFEREIIGERIRDKVAASKRKGKYMGGPPVLGYDVDRTNKKLVVNEKEAELVRYIFKQFLKTGSPTLLAKELNKQGHTTKSYVTVAGHPHEGRPWNKTHIYRTLHNNLYLGEVVHQGNHYPGEHEAIISRDLWRKAHSILEQNCAARGAYTKAKTPALLKGIIRCGHCDHAMTMSFTRKPSKKVYRYYVCVGATKKGYDTCPVRTVAAGEIEEVVKRQLRAVFTSPELIERTYQAAKKIEADEMERLRTGKADLELQTLQSEKLTEREVIEAFDNLDQVWDELFPAEQARLVHLLIERVTVYQDDLNIKFRANGLQTLIAEMKNDEEIHEGGFEHGHEAHAGS